MARTPRRSKTSARKAETSREVSKSPTEDRKSEDGAASEESLSKSREMSEEIGQEMEEEEGDRDENNSSSESEEESSSEDDAPPPTLMVRERARRSTAGNKMAALLSSAEHEDEFYKTAYGGFEENNEVDREFESPVHSDDDEVDSDFDRPENEEDDKDGSGGENDEDRPRRKKNRKFKEPKRGLTADDVLAKNKKWAMARLAGNMVAANTVDERTQGQRLKEAQETERINVESLRKYEEFELEKKKKREKGSARNLPGPRERVKMTREGTTLTVSSIKEFVRERPRERLVCAVTGRPARYTDPITRLPYSTPFAFKVIRDKYNKYLRTIDNNPEVSEYLARLRDVPTPPLSPRAVPEDEPMDTSSTLPESTVTA